MFDIESNKIPHSNHFSKLRIITSSGGNLTQKMIKNLKNNFKNGRNLLNARD